MYVNSRQLFANQGSTKIGQGLSNVYRRGALVPAAGKPEGWLHACFVSSKTCCKLSFVLDTSEILVYFVLWQDLARDLAAIGAACESVLQSSS